MDLNSQYIFRKNTIWSKKTGLFPETGLLGMLKATDYDAEDQVSSPLCAITDVFGGNTGNTETKNAFMMQIDLLQFSGETCFLQSGQELKYLILTQKLLSSKQLGKNCFASMKHLRCKIRNGTFSMTLLIVLDTMAE